MKNQELAKIFEEISEYLEMDGVPFKPYAYQKVALTLETLKDDVEDLYRKGGLKALKGIPGVGESIAHKIEEYLTTGQMQYYEEFKRKLPIDLDEIGAVEGVGPKKAKALYEQLGIRTLEELEAAARAHRIAPLFGFGDRTEQNILQAIEFLKVSKGRFLLGEILPLAHRVLEELQGLPEVERADTAGSVRRRKETIGDVDFLVISTNPAKVMDFFVSLPGVVKVWGRGATKSSVRLKAGCDMDIRVIPPESYGAALQYFTGSKDHNIALRKIAIDLGYKLSEYGLFQGPKLIAAATEEEVYAKLGMPWIPPELRENRGEIEAARAGRLPDLIGYGDLRGDLHVHCDWDGGANSIEEIVEAALALGYEYVGISDHTKFLRIERGLDEERLRARNLEIDKLNDRLAREGKQFRVLKGCEANILADGGIDIEDAACGLALIYYGRPWVALLGLLGAAAAYLYSASPVQLMSKGLGELTIFLAFGPVLSLGAYYALTGTLKPEGFCIGLPLAGLITAILWINEFPDLEADVAAAKQHLVARLGLKKSRWVYTALMLAPFVSLPLLMEIFHLPGHLLAGLVALPPAVKSVRQAWRTDSTDEDFVAVQALTIKTHFLLGLALTLAFLYAAWRG